MFENLGSLRIRLMNTCTGNLFTAAEQTITDSLAKYRNFPEFSDILKISFNHSEVSIMNSNTPSLYTTMKKCSDILCYKSLGGLV